MYEELSFKEIKKYKKQVNILLVTVTEPESTALHNLIRPLPDKEVLLVASNDSLTYNLGVLGKYVVCHVESKMGSSTMGGSIMTTHQALLDWNPTIIIMVGIAFGKDKKKQKIGDVLISQHVIQYQHIKINKLGKIEARGDQHHCGLKLLNRFKSYHKDWHYPTDKKSTLATVQIGDLLSGDVLIDYEPYRDELLALFPSAIGGEMEGTGVSNVAAAKVKEWLVIKSICDFADGNKGKFKIRKQKLAASTAASLCEHIFNKLHVFKDFKIAPLIETQKVKTNQDFVIDTDVHLKDKNVEVPEIPGLTDNGMQSDIELARAFFSLSVSNRLRIGTRLGLVNDDEARNGDNTEISAQILIRAKQKGILDQIWSIIFKSAPNPFK